MIEVDYEIELKLPEASDAESLFALVEENRAHLETFLFWVPYYRSLDAAHSFIKETNESAKHHTALHLVIRYNGVIVGCIGYRNIDRLHMSAELGFWIAKKYEGRGIITRAAKKLIAYGFETLNLERISLVTSTKNDKSQRVAEKLGFEKEGMLRHAQKIQNNFHDLYIYGLIQSV